MKQTLLFFTVFLYGIVSAQEQFFDCAKNLNGSQQVTNFRYEKYDENYIARMYDSFSQVTNSTEEELMRSVLSTTDLNWYNFNREKKVEETSQDFDAIKNADKNVYYFALINKVNFTANGIEYAVVKFHLYGKGETYGFAQAMKKINNKWVTTSDNQIANLLFFLGMVDVKYIDAIMNNKQTDNPELNKIINKNIKNNHMDLNAMLLSLQNELETNENLKSILDAYRIFK